ncbi:MAG: hypothetical protein JXB36_09615 [Gammaproteobacteria bacterium]|nr:hypothetical protein [Gammaproteobacteria bacterium]
MTEQHTQTRDDDLLSALIDGMLPLPEEQRLRDRLAAEPALTRRLEALRRADTAVRNAYTGVAREPLPQHVVDLLDAAGRRADSAAEPEEAPTVVDLARARPLPAGTGRWLSPQTALAAGIALAIGFLAGYVALSPIRAPEPGLGLVAGGASVEPGSALHQILDDAVSAEARQLDAATTAVPRLSFVDTRGDFCRQVELTRDTATAHTLACRRGTDWRIELVAFGPPAAAGADGVYRLASGDTPAALEGALDSLMDGAPLDAEAERRAIARGWVAPGAR